MWDQVSGLTPKGIKRMIISIVDADGERIIISHTAAQRDLAALAQLAVCVSIPYLYVVSSIQVSKGQDAEASTKRRPSYDLARTCRTGHALSDRVSDEDKEGRSVSRAGVWHRKIRQGAWAAPSRLNGCRVIIRLMGIRATTLQPPMPQQPQDRWREKIRRLGHCHTVHLHISSPSQSCNMHDEDDAKQPGEQMWASAP